MSDLVLSREGRAALDQCRQFHATRKTFSGNGVLKHLDAVLTLAQAVQAKTALDYGCGKGLQYEKEIGDERRRLEDLIGFPVVKYDPAHEPFAERPEGTFDLVWCTDVLESVPEADIPAVLRDVSAYANSAVFVTVATYPSKKTFQDGSNTHVTVRDREWWTAQFEALAADHPDLIVEWRIA